MTEAPEPHHEHQWINPEDDGNWECLICHVSQADHKAAENHKRLHAIFDVFLMKWLKQPPLVRASAAVSAEEKIEQGIRWFADRAAREMKRMPRRSEVTARIALSSGAISDLLMSLANHADDEAVAKGIDADLPLRSQRAAMEDLAMRQAKLDHPFKETRWVHKDGSEIAFSVETKILGDLEKVQEKIEKEIMETVTEAIASDLDKEALAGGRAALRQPRIPRSLMGWAHCGTNRHGQLIGYAVEAPCDEPGCSTVIDRGLGYLCGDMHDTDETCAKYYCGTHAPGQRCSRCPRGDDD